MQSHVTHTFQLKKIARRYQKSGSILTRKNKKTLMQLFADICLRGGTKTQLRTQIKECDTSCKNKVGSGTLIYVDDVFFILLCRVCFRRIRIHNELFYARDM